MKNTNEQSVFTTGNIFLLIQQFYSRISHLSDAV